MIPNARAHVGTLIASAREAVITPPNKNRFPTSLKYGAIAAASTLAASTGTAALTFGVNKSK
jgi:hypothetical protein